MRYHVVDEWCGFTGGEDYGAVETRGEAEKQIIEQKARGNNGGCRCSGSGWRIRDCDEQTAGDLEHQCYDYQPLSFDEALDAADRRREIEENNKIPLFIGWDKEK